MIARRAGPDVRGPVRGFEFLSIGNRIGARACAAPIGPRLYRRRPTVSAKLRTMSKTTTRSIVSSSRGALRFAAIGIVAAVVVSVAGLLTATSVARAQIGGLPAAPPAPIAPRPSAPRLPQGVLPQLLAAPEVPSILLASPAATPRAFRCTCSGPGSGAQWAGQVVAPDYVIASRAASGACTAYVLNGAAVSPIIPTPAFGFRPPAVPQTGAAAQLNTGVLRQPSAITRGQLQLEPFIAASSCSNCACN